jgi:membrane-associated phospholipid phosphatase
MSATPQAAAAPRVRFRHSAAGRRFNILMAATLVALIPVDYVLARAAHFNGSGQSLHVWTTAAFLGAILLYCRWRPLPRLVEACELAIWADLYFDALSVLIQIAGRTQRPLIDGALTRMDARLHFATAALVHWVARVPSVKIGLVLVYEIEPLLLLTALVGLPFLGKADAARQYVLGIVIAAVMTAGVFALWPAAGPWMTEGYRPTHNQTLVTNYLLLLKTSAPVNLDMQDAGIVAFPSFHVLLAVLSATALSALPRLRWPVWILAGLITFSTLTTGWHYLTDVLGGLILAGIVIAAARTLLPQDAHAPALPRDAA